MKRRLLILAGYVVSCLIFATALLIQINYALTTRGCMCSTVTQHNGKTFHGCMCGICSCNPYLKCCNICRCDNKKDGTPLAPEDVERIRRLLEDKK